MPTIDVIVPCYRYGQFLPECVASIQKQKDVEYRILIIDDCSPDNTAEVATELARHDDRITWLRHSMNRGHIATYNEGLEWASADYALVLSADDWVLPGAFGRAAALLDAHPEVGFTYGRVVHAHEGQPLPAQIHLPPEPGWRIYSGAEFLRSNAVSNWVATCTAVVRTDIQKRIGFYRSDLPHSGDLEMWMRFAAHGSVGYINACQGVYRQHTAAMSVGYYRRMLTAMQHRKAAIDVLFSIHGQRLPQSAELRDVLYRGLAKAALDAADKPFMLADWEQFEQLRNFAASVDPGIRQTIPWRIRSIERAVGPRTWKLLRSTVRTVGLAKALP